MSIKKQGIHGKGKEDSDQERILSKLNSSTMYGLMVSKYFIKVEPGMNKAEVIDGPVYSAPDSGEVVGKITDYNPRNGYMKIELQTPMDYKILVKGGVPLSNIIFNNRA